MSLKLRLNLIITALLLIIMLAGMLLNIANARMNVRAEVASTERLALYLFDTGILNSGGAALRRGGGNPLRLHLLNQMRHLRIELYAPDGRLIDSNISPREKVSHPGAPRWFEDLMDQVTPKWQSQQRSIVSDGELLGNLVITPDPSYEYAEIWKQITDLLLLLAGFFVLVQLMIAWAVSAALKPTEKILTALNRLEQGDLKARMPHFQSPELAPIGDKFNRMVETLEQSINRNHRLSQQLITLQEAERKSLARDLHDEFGQCLTAIHADATVVVQLAERKYPELRESAQAIAGLSRHLMDLVGGLLQRLRPGILDELGLVPALQDLVDTWKSRHEQVACRLVVEGSLPADLEESLQVTLYRLVQEALTNVSRHAAASSVEIRMQLRRPRSGASVLGLSVVDDGCGFDPGVAEGFGLAGMRERVEGLGGEMQLQSGAGRGTRIEISLPLVNR